MTNENRPYTPHWIHTFFDWLDRLPISPLITTLVLIPLLIGIIQHIYVWSVGLLPAGEFNTDLGTAGVYLIFLYLLAFNRRGAPRAIDDFRPLLDVSDEEFQALKYRFVTIPMVGGTIVFLALGGLSFWNGLLDKAVAPELDYAVPGLRLGIWLFAGGCGGIFVYQLARQLRQISAFYRMPERIDLFNQDPLHGFARYTATIAILIVLLLVVQQIDPTAFASYSTAGIVAYYAAILGVAATIFYLPLDGVHRRLVAEKRRLLQENNTRIDTILQRIHAAAFEHEDYTDVGGMRNVFAALQEERTTLKGLSTWPWRPGTLNGVLSAIFLPIILSLLRDFITGLLGVG